MFTCVLEMLVSHRQWVCVCVCVCVRDMQTVADVRKLVHYVFKREPECDAWLSLLALQNESPGRVQEELDQEKAAAEKKQRMVEHMMMQRLPIMRSGETGASEETKSILLETTGHMFDEHPSDLGTEDVGNIAQAPDIESLREGVVEFARKCGERIKLACINLDLLKQDLTAALGSATSSSRPGRSANEAPSVMHVNTYVTHM